MFAKSIFMLKLRFLLLSAFACLFASACVTTDTRASGNKVKKPQAREEPEEQEEPREEKLRVGMTKSQVLRIKGEPSGRDETGSGEIWVYGNARMLRMIPYAGPFLNVNTSKIMFNNSGRVVDFRNTNSGNVWSQGEGMGGSRFSNW